MIRIVTGVLLLGLFAGCGSETKGRWVFEKAGATEADMKKDQSQCFAAAIPDSTSDNFGPTGRIDREAYRKCMERRGYTVRVQ